MQDEFSRELPCELTDEEVADRSDRLAHAIEQRDELDAERSEVAKKYRREIDAFVAEITMLAEQVRDRVETREVQCTSRVEKDGAVCIIREDTGEVIEQRHADPGTQLRLRMAGKELPDDEAAAS